MAVIVNLCPFAVHDEFVVTSRYPCLALPKLNVLLHNSGASVL